MAVLFWVAIWLPVGFGAARAAEEQAPLRMANHTLRLPDRIAGGGYRLVDAFPGVSFHVPVGLVAPPGETNRLFVVERTGRIYVITNLAQPTKSLFLDLSQRVVAGDLEGGLLGLAFHPGFSTNGLFFVCWNTYASTPGAPNHYHDVVSRFEVSAADRNVALPGSELTILAQVDDSDIHNAGDLKFGPDGYLYVSIGERLYRDFDWLDQTPVDRDLQGAILRIDVDGRPGNLPPNPHPASTDRYWIPADNPFVGVTEHHGLAVRPSEVRTELYAIGLRNPWRMAFDPLTGDLYVADVGNARQEEVDLVVAGGDYGWPYFEGLLPFVYVPPPQFSPIPPLHVYSHFRSGGTNGECVIGGIVCRGSAIPWLEGSYLFADIVSGYVWALRRHEAGTVVERLLGATPGLTSFSPDPRDGGVLATHLHYGTIHRLVYTLPAEVTNPPPTLAETGIFADLKTLAPNPGILPYEINVPFWSDHAQKTRWFCLPETNQSIGFSPLGLWTFPTGAVWVKHFELELTNGQPASLRRLETRVLVNARDGFYGLTYRWGESTTNAWLVPAEGQTELLTIRDANGAILREQEWRYPARSDCMNCHTEPAGRVLGFNTAQLNRAPPTGAMATNQLLAFGTAGYLTPAPSATDELPALAAANDSSAPLEFRVRSYFQANCSQCHRPGGPTWAKWDARFTTPLKHAEIASFTAGFEESVGTVVRPGSLEQSRLHNRLLGYPRPMPPIGSTIFNSNAIDLVANWITNLPPEPWPYESIGDVIHLGGSTLSNGVYRVGGAGVGVQGAQDSFQFMHRPFEQPAAQFVARLISQSGLAGKALAGLMIREGAGTADRFIMAACRADGLALSLRRFVTNAPTVSELAGPVAMPQWLRLVRFGNEISAFRSDDGTNWIGLGASVWETAGPCEVGFAVSSSTRTAFNNATFDNASWLSIALTSSAPIAIQQPAKVTLQARVERSGRELARVEFYDGTEKVGEAGSPPYSLALSNLWSGVHEFSVRAVDEAGAAVLSQPLRLPVRPHPSLATMPLEAHSSGASWPMDYGAEGYLIVNERTNLPAFVQVSLAGATSETWDADTQDERALLKEDTRSGIAAAWKAPDSFTVSLTVRDGRLHRLSLYCLDWDTTNERIQLVEFIEPVTRNVMSSHVLSNFSGGVYLALTIRGNVDVRLSALAGPGPVLSGLFLDQRSNAVPSVNLVRPVAQQSIPLPSDLAMEASAVDSDGQVQRVEFYLDGQLVGVTEQRPFRVVMTNLLDGTHAVVARAYDDLIDFADSLPVSFQTVLPRNKVIFLGEDAVTRGNWSERYGAGGFLLSPLMNWWPTAFPYEVRGASPWIQQFGLDLNYLEQPGQVARAFSFLYSVSNIVYDLNLADGRPWQVALYFFHDSAGAQGVTILDPATGQDLDARTVTNGFGGRYLVWNIQGHVLLQVPNLAVTTQARVNGLFLDPFTNSPTEVRLVQPAAELEALTPARILLEATAQAPDGLRRVEFRTGTAKLGEVIEPPYQFLWEFPVAGNHEVFARAVSAAGAASDSEETTVRVRFATPPAARFVRSETTTGGDWKGAYGTEGYWMPSNFNYSNLPPTVSIQNTQTWVDYGDWGQSRQLRRPHGSGRIMSFWLGEMVQFQLRFNDGRAHQLSLYNYAPGWTNRLTVSILSAATETLLDRREIASQEAGTYLTWDIVGEVVIRFDPGPQSYAFLNGIFVDRGPNGYEEWQRRYFTLSGQAHPATSGEMADPDSDGYINWTEYLLGRNPAAPDLQAPLWLERGAGGMLLHVLVSNSAGDGDVAVESSSDLQTWVDAMEGQPVEVRDRAEQLERLFQVLPNKAPTLFFRLRFQPPWPPPSMSAE